MVPEGDKEPGSSLLSNIFQIQNTISCQSELNNVSDFTAQRCPYVWTALFPKAGFPLSLHWITLCHTQTGVVAGGFTRYPTIFSPESSLAMERCLMTRAMPTISSKDTLPLCLTGTLKGKETFRHFCSTLPALSFRGQNQCLHSTPLTVLDLLPVTRRLLQGFDDQR